MTEPARYHCCDRNRRNATAEHPTLNGLDALEVIDRDLPEADPLRQRTLLLFFLKSITGAGFTRDNVRISGGERVRDPAVVWAEVASTPPPQLSQPGEAATAAAVAALPDPQNVLVVRVASDGDYSPYTLRLVRSAVDDAPPAGLDPRMVEIEFSFKVECPSDFDCRTEPICADEVPEAPEIDYLARDYTTFRRLLLDRMAHQVPGWRERSVADAGVALTELLAYVGDHLSYRQDAIATEAYLGTARKRVSLRRHAQLVDYAMHDGCNARTFVQLQLDPALVQLALPRAGTQFLTRCDRVPVAIAAGSQDLTEAMRQGPAVFEPMRDALLFSDHNALSFYTWGDERCCLAKGATRATLAGSHPNLHAGDWLLFEEVIGPLTGEPGDADPTHRQVVQLTRVWESEDPLPPDAPVTVTEIEWAAEDALSFPLCLSSVSDELHGSQRLADVSMAAGNLVLADHGRTIPIEQLGTVPAPHLFAAVAHAAHCDAPPRDPVPVRFRPTLANGPITQVAPAMLTGSAARALRAVVDEALPSINLTGTYLHDDTPWNVQRNLLNSRPLDPDLVAEVEDDGTTSLRFGDDRYGKRPDTGTVFAASYRVGNGSAGNIGADSLVHVVGADVSALVLVRNPLPARGGVDPESAERVRRRAPEAFRTQQRAVTPADYVEVTQRFSGVQRAAARLRWTGSWYTVFVTVDRTGGAPLDNPTRHDLTAHLDSYRMAGHDLEFEPPDYVSLQLSLHVCVKPDYFRSDVRSGLIEMFSNRVFRDGRRGLFHPDNFSFGQPVYLSPLIAAAHQVPGVQSIEVVSFGRQSDDDPIPLDDGQFVLRPREIARLDNDPNFPEHGVLALDLHGGK